MKIVASRKFKCTSNGESFETPVIGKIIDAPDWVADDVYFAMLKRAGLVSIVKDTEPQPEPTAKKNDDENQDGEQLNETDEKPKKSKKGKK